MKKTLIVMLLLIFTINKIDAYQNSDFKFTYYDKIILIKESDLDLYFNEFISTYPLLYKNSKQAYISYKEFKDALRLDMQQEEYMFVTNLGTGTLPSSLGLWYLKEDDRRYPVLEKQYGKKEFKKSNELNGLIFTGFIRKVLNEAKK